MTKTKVINGTKYVKESYDTFYYHYGKSKKVPYSVICECGNNEFTLKYGNYEIKAICTKCGRSDMVYDG